MAKQRLTPGERKRVIQLQKFRFDQMQYQLKELAKAKQKLFTLLEQISEPILRKLVQQEIEDTDKDIIELNRQQYKMGSLYEIQD